MSHAHATQFPTPSTPADDAPPEDEGRRAADEGGGSGVLDRLVEPGRERVRERPLTAVSGAIVVGFVAGSLTPRLIAQPLGVIALKVVLARVFGDDSVPAS